MLSKKDRLKLRRKRKRFLRDFTHVVGLKEGSHPRALKILTEALGFSCVTTAANVILGHRNCAIDPVEALKRYMRDKKRKRNGVKLDYDCLLNPNLHHRGASRRQMKFVLPSIHPTPHRGSMALQMEHPYLKMRVECNGPGRRRVVLKDVSSVRVLIYPA